MASDQHAKGGLSLKTLLIASASSAVAALVIPMIWRPGTVFAAAMTPVVVTVVTEMLRRPVDTVTSVAVRRTPGGTVVRERTEREFDPLAPPTEAELRALEQDAPGTPPRHVERHRRRLSSRQWRIAIITGLVGFAIAAAVVTITELAAGDAVSAPGARTTLFGGSAKPKAEATPTPSATPTGSATPAGGTPTPTPTPSASPRATPTPSATPSPAPSAAAAPAPQSATPAPTPAP